MSSPSNSNNCKQEFNLAIQRTVTSLPVLRVSNTKFPAAVLQIQLLADGSCKHELLISLQGDDKIPSEVIKSYTSARPFIADEASPKGNPNPRDWERFAKAVGTKLIGHYFHTFKITADFSVGLEMADQLRDSIAAAGRTAVTNLTAAMEKRVA